MIYATLQAISTAIYVAISTAWFVEGKIPYGDKVHTLSECNVIWLAETLIKLMMTCFLMAIRLACHPLMVMPVFLGGYFLIKKIWVRHSAYNDIDGKCGVLSRTPRLRSYRSNGNISSRSTESFELDVSEDDVCRRS